MSSLTASISSGVIPSAPIRVFVSDPGRTQPVRTSELAGLRRQSDTLRSSWPSTTCATACAASWYAVSISVAMCDAMACSIAAGSVRPRNGHVRGRPGAKVSAAGGRENIAEQMSDPSLEYAKAIDDVAEESGAPKRRLMRALAVRPATAIAASAFVTSCGTIWARSIPA